MRDAGSWRGTNTQCISTQWRAGGPSEGFAISKHDVEQTKADTKIHTV